MALFTGHGYSEAFTENMASVISALQAGEAFLLVPGQDDICAVCPNLLPDGGCAHGTEDVQRRDQGAFAVLGAAPGGELTWQEVRRRLLGIGEEQFQAVCSNCRWAAEGLCSLALLQKQLA